MSCVVNVGINNVTLLHSYHFCLPSTIVFKNLDQTKTLIFTPVANHFATMKNFGSLQIFVAMAPKFFRYAMNNRFGSVNFSHWQSQIGSV
jgi:hypothetical protein